MAKGKKYNDDIKEKAFALLAVNNSVSYVANQLELPRSTVKSWKEAYDKKANAHGGDTIAKLRQKKKEEFVENAWDLIGKIQTILERRLERVVFNEDRMDALMEQIQSIEDKELTDSQRKTLYQRISAMKIESIKELTVALGTLYDKQALANKEATSIVEGNLHAALKFEDL